MRKALDKDAELQLKLRVHLSHTTHLFTRGDIAEGFGIALMTLTRYISPAARRYSNEMSYKKTQENKAVDTSACYKCGHKILGHKRCDDCESLLHESGNRCDYCTVIAERRMLRM